MVLFGDSFMSMIKTGTLLEAQNKALYMASSVPTVYLAFWGCFAVLFFLARDPKAPSAPNWFTRFKRAPKQIPLQSDPILVNGTWLVKH